MIADLDQHWSKNYDSGQDFQYINQNELDKIFAKMPVKSNGTCLDLGCGTGQASRELHHRGFNVLGIDASTSAINIAKNATTKDSMRYVVADLESDMLVTLVGTGSFDVVFCKLVYAFIKDKLKFLDVVSKLLNKNGVFVITTPLIGDVAEEKKGIAVKEDELTNELSAKFTTIQQFKSRGTSFYVCKAKQGICKD